MPCIAMMSGDSGSIWSSTNSGDRRTRPNFFGGGGSSVEVRVGAGVEVEAELCTVATGSLARPNPDVAGKSS